MPPTHSPARNAFLSVALLLMAVAFSPLKVHGVILSGGDGTGNAGMAFGSSYVGSVNGASGVYLGSYNGGFWVLTANHVGGGNITLGLTPTLYTMVGGSYSQIGTTDLGVFRISSDPGLANLNLFSGDLFTNTNLTMVGYGRDRQAALTNWTVNTATEPDTWTEGSGPTTGYKWAGTSSRHSGTNTPDSLANINYTVGATTYTNVKTFVTDFDPVTGEAQAALGDSGGGVFDDAGNLVGIMVATGAFNGQPGNTAVHGNITYSVQIKDYRTQILAAVPEPSVAGLLAAFGATFIATHRRRTARSFSRR